MDKKNLIEYDFQVEKYYVPAFSLNTYFIVSDEECALVDPIFDPALYDQLLEETSTTLKYIFLTHEPYQYISNYEELAKKTEAQVVMGEYGNQNFKNKNESIFELGKIKIKLINTPGFTKDSTSYILINSKGVEKAIFTGATVTLGDVGHSQLIDGTTEEDKNNKAQELFTSIEVIKKLDPNITVFPGYGPDSVCGGKIEQGHSCHLSLQLETNPYFKMEKEEFINRVKSTFQKMPPFYQKISKTNIPSGKTMEGILSEIKHLSSDEIKKMIADDTAKEIFIIDTRDQGISTKGYIKSSMIMSLKVGFVKFFLCLMNPKNKYIIITEKNKQNESINLIMQMGYFNILGYSDIETWKEGGNECENVLYEQTTVENITTLIENKEYIIDIREVPEFKSVGIIKGAVLSPLSGFAAKYNEVPKDKTIHILCKSGARAAIAYSFLKRMGYENKLIILEGACMKLETLKYQFEHYQQ